MMRSSKALGPGVIAFIDHLICIVPAFSYTDGLHIVHLLWHLEPWITGLFANILCFVCSPCPERVPISFYYWCLSCTHHDALEPPSAPNLVP